MDQGGVRGTTKRVFGGRVYALRAPGITLAACFKIVWYNHASGGGAHVGPLAQHGTTRAHRGQEHQASYRLGAPTVEVRVKRRV